MKFLNLLESLGSDGISMLQVQLLCYLGFVITDSMDTETERAKCEIKDRRKCCSINGCCCSGWRVREHAVFEIS